MAISKKVMTNTITNEWSKKNPERQSAFNQLIEKLNALPDDIFKIVMDKYSETFKENKQDFLFNYFKISGIPNPDNQPTEKEAPRLEENSAVESEIKKNVDISEKKLPDPEKKIADQNDGDRTARSIHVRVPTQAYGIFQDFCREKGLDEKTILGRLMTEFIAKNKNREFEF